MNSDLFHIFKIGTKTRTRLDLRFNFKKNDSGLDHTKFTSRKSFNEASNDQNCIFLIGHNLFFFSEGLGENSAANLGLHRNYITPVKFHIF